MKNKQSFYIQIFIAVALIGSWAIYQSQYDDRDIYNNVFLQAKVGAQAEEVISSNLPSLIRSAERVVIKSPDQKPLVDLMKEIEVVTKELRSLIQEIHSPFIKYDESKPFDKHTMPIDYNSKRPVGLALDKVMQDNLRNASQDFLETLKGLCAQDMREKGVPERLVSDDELKLYYNRMDSIFKNNTLLLTEIIEENRLEEVAKHYDAAHAESFFRVLRYEIKCLEWLLLDNVLQILKSENAEIKPIIMMAQEKPVKVGEPTELEFIQSSYVVSDSMKVRVNGKPLEVKSGIAYLNYRPTSTGMKYFKIDISLKKPFTGKTETYSRTQKIEVIE
jgi:hypothetical protein